MTIPEYYHIDHEDHKHIFMIVSYGYCIPTSQILKINLLGKNNCISIVSYDRERENLENLIKIIDKHYKKFPKILVRSINCDLFDKKYCIINDKGLSLLIILTHMGNKILLKTILDYKMQDFDIEFVCIYGYNSNIENSEEAASKIHNYDNLPKIALKR